MSRGYWRYRPEREDYWRYRTAAAQGEMVGDAIGCLFPLILKAAYFGLAAAAFYGIVRPLNLTWSLREFILGSVPGVALVAVFLIFATLFLKLTRGNTRYVFRALWLSFAQSWYPRIALVAWLIVWCAADRPVASGYAYGNFLGSANVIIQLCLGVFIAFYASLQFRADDVRIERIASSLQGMFGFRPEVFLGRGVRKVQYAVELPHNTQLDSNEQLRTMIVQRFPQYNVTFAAPNTIWFELVVANHFAPIWRVTRLGSVKVADLAGKASAKIRDKKADKSQRDGGQ